MARNWNRKNIKNTLIPMKYGLMARSRSKWASFDENGHNTGMPMVVKVSKQMWLNPLKNPINIKIKTFTFMIGAKIIASIVVSMNMKNIE
jgi:hypothetical protein